MKAKIIKRKPHTGKSTPLSFGKGDGDSMCVKFIDNAENKWVGYFMKGAETGFSEVLSNPKEDKSLVISNGEGYFVDVEKKKLLTEFDSHKLIVSALKTHNPDLFVAGTEESIYILSNDGHYVEIFPDFKVDGFYFKEQQDNTVKGRMESSLNNFEGLVDFSIDLSNYSLRVNY